ncbi:MULTISPECIES: TIGR04255 family protein [Sphingobium]|uniref:TIGR04255 family protein n=1 Tax=Sphingobium TaxID=165695 RepID=UPI0013EA4876|nr:MULTISPECIES: TIGR04255 family protein [Sphingobium]WDA37482.1 TIGR04255 family protein [Sphingobium sp. YC-XJ3]
MNERASDPQYTAPPIIEAVIEFRFANGLPDADLSKIGKRLKRSYANQLDGQNVEFQFNIEAQHADFSTKPTIRLSSEDQADIAVIQQQTLTWSRLAPYLGWDSFIERVRSDAEEVHKIVGPFRLDRIGVRYINRIDVPLNKDGGAPYGEYLAINIDIPESIQSVKNYAWRFEYQVPDSDLLAILQSAIVSPEVPNTGAFILDVDVVASQNIPLRIDEIFIKLEEMRRAKNRFFEMSIRDEARRMFDK